MLRNLTQTLPECPPWSASKPLGQLVGKSTFWELPPRPRISKQHLGSLSTYRRKGLPYFISAAPCIQGIMGSMDNLPADLGFVLQHHWAAWGFNNKQTLLF